MFADFLRDNQKKNLNFFLDITETIGKNLVQKKQFNEFVAMKLGKKIKELIFENNTIFNSINSKCMNLFEKTIFNDDNDDKSDAENLRLFYIKKLLIETKKIKMIF